MSVKTFIGWFFGWLSAFKIDFRKEIDPYCGHNPKMLACDGTHIGVLLRHLRLDNPVTKTDINDQVPWLHGRVTRRLFQNEELRTHMNVTFIECFVHFKLMSHEPMSLFFSDRHD